MSRIEDYALLGDTHSAALVSRDGSIDWLCLPRFDSPSCFGALLDKEKGGRWRIAPKDYDSSARCYRPDSLVLETTFETSSGSAKIIDCLPFEEVSPLATPRDIHPFDLIVRVVEGIEGTVPMEMAFEPRFDYGSIVPWFRRRGQVVRAIGGPDALDLNAGTDLEVKRTGVYADFEIAAGDSIGFVVARQPSHLPPREEVKIEDCHGLVDSVDRFWRDWVGRCMEEGPHRDLIVRSLLTLKALSYSPTGGIVAAATTSLPEAIGGERNWDYRYCWLRDSTFTLEVLLRHGFTSEAEEWRDWLMRAVAGDPEDLQIMYGVRGERRLVEIELTELAGYEDSRPVRIGNAASEQFQLDVYGEVMDSFNSARRAGIETTDEEWELEKDIIGFVIDKWREPDEGIWEVRSGSEHFVHSKVMAWVAMDRAIAAVEQFGEHGDVDLWKKVRDEIRDEIMTRGVANGRFKRSYDDDSLDASLLALPLVGFIDATDEVMQATIEAIEAELLVDGFVLRYKPDVPDGLESGEGAFLLCSFWLVDCLYLIGREDDARDMFERLISVRNDLGLLSEQYDPHLKRLVGNFPQAFSHIAMATAASILDEGAGALARMH